MLKAYGLPGMDHERGDITRRRFLGGVGAAIGAGVLAACRGGEAAQISGSTVPVAGSSTRWPAEWERHQATLMSMPHKAVIYGGAERLAQCQQEWASVARAINRFEPVTVVVPSKTSKMRELLGPGVDLGRVRQRGV